jgi:hypothetical protein
MVTFYVAVESDMTKTARFEARKPATKNPPPVAWLCKVQTSLFYSIRGIKCAISDVTV